jgi:hypothetical protein
MDEYERPPASLCNWEAINQTTGAPAMQITVERREQYGSPVYFPACPAAQTFAAIAKTKTLTPQAIAQIKTLGYAVTVKHPQPTI